MDVVIVAAYLFLAIVAVDRVLGALYWTIGLRTDIARIGKVCADCLGGGFQGTCVRIRTHYAGKGIRFVKRIDSEGMARLVLNVNRTECSSGELDRIRVILSEMGVESSEDPAGGRLSAFCEDAAEAASIAEAILRVAWGVGDKTRLRAQWKGKQDVTWDRVRPE